MSQPGPDLVDLAERLAAECPPSVGRISANGHQRLPESFTVDGMRCVGVRAIVVVAALVGAALFGTPAAASAAGPVDWTVISTFISGGGEDVPLRVGSHDTPVADGFGARHIRDGHEEVPPDTDIELVLSGSARNCAFTPVDEKWRCSMKLGDRSLFVVFTERVDDASGDGRPVGIITAYYSPRGCPC